MSHADEMTEHDIRVALVRLSHDHDPGAPTEESAETIRRVVAAIDRLPDEPGEQG